MWALTQMIGSDKIEHFLIFTTVSFLVATFALFLTPMSNGLTRIVTSNATLSFIGIVEEFRQYFDPHHTPELLDAISDILGVVVGSSPLLLLFFLWKLFNRHKRATISAKPVFFIGLIVTCALLYGLSFISETPSHVNGITVKPSLSGAHATTSHSGPATGTSETHSNIKEQTTVTSSATHAQSNKKVSKLDEIIKMAEANDQRLEAKAKGSSTGALSSKQSANIAHDTNQSPKETEINKAASHSSSSSLQASEAKIIQEHKPQFQTLEHKTQNQVNHLFKQAMTDYESKKNSVNKLALLFLFNKYKNQASQIEQQTNQKFQKLYASLQSDLKKHGYNPSDASSIKSQFNQQKEATRKALLQRALDAFLGNPQINSASDTHQ